ncbi:membrane protein insertase YidC [Clostridium tertium]|uniref:Membrane protein insertase MisCB n=1 Tax=Clostridium tertium TaxID=1559 RepID=A0A6N3AFC0_9CLOT
MDIIINIFKNGIEFLYGFTGDIGIAIVLLTLVVKLILLPFSIKQRIAMKKQLVVNKKIEIIKDKYKNNKKKQEVELNKIYRENSKGLVGCLIPFLQLPVISGLYMSINRLKVETITMLIPWVANIGSIDNKFVVPLIYTLITVAPSIMSYLRIFGNNETPVTIKSILPMIIFGILVTVKAPVGIGIYFITSGLFNLIEDVGFRIYSKNKAFA